MSHEINNTGFKLQTLLDEVQQMYVSLPESGSADIIVQIPESLPPIIGNDSQVRTFLALMIDSLLQNSLQNEPIVIEGRELPASVDVLFKIKPNPMFVVLFKSLRDAIEQRPTPQAIQSSPDSLVSYLLALKLGLRNHIKTWFEIDKDSGTTIHNYFLQIPRIRLQRERPLVLIIEDTKPISMLMELYLRQAGYSTMIAHDGITGIRLAREHKPDLISLDLMMPQKDGWQVLSELKSAPETASIPVIIVSVLKDKQIGFELGASDYLTKPVVCEDLVECAERITTQTTPAPVRIHSDMQNPFLLTASRSQYDRLSTSFQNLGIHTDFLSQRYYTDILNNRSAPDLFVIDFTENFSKALSVAYRLRLTDQWDHVPIVAVLTSDKEHSLRFRSHGIINAFAFLPDFSLSEIREQLSPENN